MKGSCFFVAAALSLSAVAAFPDDEDFGGAAADWKPSFTAHGFNLQGMRRAGPNVGFREEHFKWMKEWGFNFVRMPVDYRCWVKDMKSENREIIVEEGLKPLDEGIAFARKHGLVVMVCLHRIPGEYCVPQADPEPGNIYTDPECLRAAVMHWELLARRYRDFPREELFFNLINEPSSRLGTMEQYERVARTLIAAIRKIDPKRFIVADGWQGGNIPVPGLYGIPGVGQAARGYYPYKFSHFGIAVAGAPKDDKVPVYPPTWPPRLGRPDGRLGGPKWPDWHEPFTVKDAPAAGYALVLAEVSGPVRIEVTADGERVSSFSLEPRKDDSQWSNLSRYRGTGPWRGTPTSPLVFTLGKSAGELSVQVVKGDWAMPERLVLKGHDGREARLDFGQNMKAMKTVAWRRRFVGWSAAEPMPPADGVAVPSGRFADEGMNVMYKGWLDRWEEPVKNGVWCLAGEFGCANHTSHGDSLRFLESDLKLFDALGIGWCSWGFIGSRFGILDSGRSDVKYENWHGRKLDREMLELLRRHAAKDKAAALAYVPEIVLGSEPELARFAKTAWAMAYDHVTDCKGAIYDISAAEPHSLVKILTPASYWPLLAGVVPAERARRLVRHLMDERKLGGVVPFPSVSRDSRHFNPKGEYWRGGVWLPTSYMCVRALEENGFADLADELAERMVRHQYATYRGYSPHTIWEAYSPTEPKPATCKVNVGGEDKLVRPDFCGWSALGPICMMIENVVGINADGAKREVEWRLRRSDRHGVKNLRFGGVTASLVYEDGNVEVESSAPFTLRVAGSVHEIPAGVTTIPVGL